MRFLFTIIFFVTILACGRTGDSRLTSSDKIDSLIVSDSLVLDSLDFNIIMYDTSYHYIFPKTFQATELSDKEIRECEVLLRLFVADYNVEATKRFDEVTKKHPKLKFNVEDFTIELEDYGRQYIAVMSDNGTRMVYVNCFCNPGEFDYRDRELVNVFDGGNCFFSFKVNLTEKRIFDFMENAVA